MMGLQGIKCFKKKGETDLVGLFSTFHLDTTIANIKSFFLVGTCKRHSFILRPLVVVNSIITVAQAACISCGRGHMSMFPIHLDTHPVISTHKKRKTWNNIFIRFKIEIESVRGA